MVQILQKIFVHKCNTSLSNWAWKKIWNRYGGFLTPNQNFRTFFRTFNCFGNNLLGSLSMLLIFPCNSQQSKVIAPFQVFYGGFPQKFIVLFSKWVAHISFFNTLSICQICQLSFMVKILGIKFQIKLQLMKNGFGESSI